MCQRRGMAGPSARLSAAKRNNSDLEAAIAAANALQLQEGEDLDDVEAEVIAEIEAQPLVDLQSLELRKPLGSGGQGGVWLAIDRAGNRVAVKEVRPYVTSCAA